MGNKSKDNTRKLATDPIGSHGSSQTVQNQCDEAAHMSVICKLSFIILDPHNWTFKINEYPILRDQPVHDVRQTQRKSETEP